MGFWDDAQTNSFYQPLQDASNQAIGGYDLAAKQKQAQILRGAKMGLQGLTGNLGGQGLGRSTMLGGFGTGNVNAFNANVGNQLAGNQAELNQNVNQTNFQTQQFIRQLQEQARQNAIQYGVSPMGALSGITNLISTGAKFALGPLGL